MYKIKSLSAASVSQQLLQNRLELPEQFVKRPDGKGLMHKLSIGWEMKVWCNLGLVNAPRLGFFFFFFYSGLFNASQRSCVFYFTHANSYTLCFIACKNDYEINLG